MALENLVGPDIFIDNLVRTNPALDDPVSQGDDHLRGIKNSLLNSFPAITGAVTATQDQLNAVATIPRMGTTLNNVTGSRNYNITYTNNGSTVMTVIVSGNTFSNSGDLTATVNGVIAARQTYNFTSGTYPLAFTWLVPPGATYQLTGFMGIANWAEYT